MKGNTDVWQTTASVLQLRRRARSQCIVSTTCCIDNNVSTHVKESVFREPGNFCCGIRYPGLWNPEYSSKNPESYQGLESRFQVPLTNTGIQYLESEIHGVESRIQDCLGFPYMRQIVSQTRPDGKKADCLLVYATFAHLGSVAPLNVILRLYTSSETQGQSVGSKKLSSRLFSRPN